MSMLGDSSARLTRRGFLKGSVAAAGALGLGSAGAMATASGWLAPAQANADVDEHVAFTYHQSHCGSRCALKCTVRDGRLVMVQPNDHAADARYRHVCLKGISEVQHIYGAGRVQAPLKRVEGTERGENSFEQITWEQALDEIVDKLKEVQAAHGNDSVLVKTCAEADSGWLAAMLGARGCAFNNGIDIGVGNGLDPATGTGWGYAMSTQETRDWVNSRLVILMGSNHCESSITTTRAFFEAKEAGCKIVMVDPHYSTTASKASEWVPIEPGTDAALILGMISHILDKGLIDEEFASLHSSLPFLVGDDGMLLRGDAPKATKDDPEPKAPFMVVDKDGATKPHTEAKMPKLQANATVKGKKARTVYSMLLENQVPYTTEWAAGVTGVPQAKIEELAELYAAGPACIGTGWGGNDKMSNADVSGHAIAIIVALTGNIGKKGAGVGCYVGGNYNGYGAGLGGWAMPEKYAAGPADMQMRELRESDAVHAIFSVGDLVAQQTPAMHKTEEWVRGLDLVVIADPYFTENCKWADYVLPVCTRFECDEEYSNVAQGHNHICLQEKIVDPIFDSRTEFWMQKEIAKRLGCEDAVPASAMERAELALSTSADPYYNTLTIEKLRENQSIWPNEGIEEPKMVFMDKKFPTESGNMDVYYDFLIDFDQQLPNWEECNEAYAGNPMRETYPLQLANTRTRFRIHSQFNDAAWIQQFYEPTISVNPADVEGKGIKSGDTVRVFNDRGEIKVKVHVNESIRPGSARLYEAATSDFTVEGNMQVLTNDYVPPRGAKLMMGPVAPFSDTLVAIEKA